MMTSSKVIVSLFFSLVCYKFVVCNVNVPIIVTTWKFVNATEKAWKTILNGSSIDAIEVGCKVCEDEQCDGTVGYGGSPDETGETTLDAFLMDGNTMNIGAVAAMKRIKSAISVARHVLEHTGHSILAGESATKFAKEMGFKEESLSTKHSEQLWSEWQKSNCQPNFWQNVVPNSKSFCGPYKPESHYSRDRSSATHGSIYNHDTICMLAIDKSGHIAAGTSTNGAIHKIPGRVGDAPIPGAGAYADSTVGAAACSGDGDIMMRFLPSFFVVEEMKRGTPPSVAAEKAIERIRSYYPSFFGIIVAVDKYGNHGGACSGMEKFSYCIANSANGVKIETRTCTKSVSVQLV